jgi:hypothetical protein
METYKKSSDFFDLRRRRGSWLSFSVVGVALADSRVMSKTDQPEGSN